MQPVSDPSDEEIDPRFAQRKSKMILDHEGQPWFFRMRGSRDPGLVGWYGQKNMTSGMVIAKDVLGEKKEYKMFSWFESAEAFFKWATAKGGDWNYYEVIGATIKEQHPYFDIDLTPDLIRTTMKALGSAVVPTIQESALALAYLLVTELETVFRNTYPEFQRVNNDWLGTMLFTSDYPIDEKTGEPRKFSYHIVFGSVYFQGHEEMRAFGKHFKAISPILGAVVDDIWHSTRQFRTLGSWKLGKPASSAKKANSKALLFNGDSFVTHIRRTDKKIPNTLTAQPKAASDSE